MPENKLQYYAALAERTARQLTDSLENWTAFLDTAARLYKYPYHEQLMIYAQRPDATACADYDTWNKTMRRYIRRGTKGIALLDQDGDTPKLKYVYDLADTGTRQNSRPVNLWRMEQEHMDSVFYTLDQNYGVADISIHNILEEISATLAEEFWDNHNRDIIGIVDDSFLEEYTDDTIGVRFREAVAVSTTYTIMARCGMESPFTHEDFLPVFEFNTPDTIAAIGTAVSQISEQVLRDIEITIKIMKKKGYSEMKNELTYTRVGDYSYPNLTLQNPQPKSLGKYGRMRREYLKNHRPILYNRLILSEKLHSHLTEIEETANGRLEQMMDELTKANNVTEQMKSENPMLWVQTMNNLKSQAEEAILTELIYS